MSQLLKMTAALVMVPALILAIASPALAAGEGQTEGGDIYRIKNLTKNIDYRDPANADACDQLSYRVRIHNPGPGVINGVVVKASLSTGVAALSQSSTVTISASNANPASTSDTAVVNLSSSQSLSYENGSTQLLGANGEFLQNLPDGITQAGVNIGGVGVSVDKKRFVQFKVKVSCPQPAPVSKFECKALDVNQIDRTRFDFTARASAENATIQSYTFTVRNAAGVTVDTKTVNTNATSAVYNFNQSTSGTYTVSVVVKTDKGSTVETTACSKQVTVKEQPTTPVVQGKTTELPDTGAGSALSLFAGASALGAAGHYALRRFRG